MLLRHFLAVSASSLAAQAFLIPIEVANSAIESSSDNLQANIISPSNRVIKLDCPNCAFADRKDKDGPITWKTGVKNSLILNFTADNEQLLLNESPLYPVPGSLFAPQVHTEESLVALKTNGYPLPLLLSYALEAGPETPFVGKEGQLYSIQIDITAIDTQLVDIGGVQLKALKDAEGKFMILSVTTIPHYAPHSGKDKECTMPPRLCNAHDLVHSKLEELKAKIAKARARLAAKVAAMKGGIIKGCHGRVRPHHGVSAPKDHHEHAKSHHHHGSFATKVDRIFAHVLLPILVGIAAGMAASALGLLLGRIIVLTWALFKRRETEGRCALSRHGEETVGEDGEKDGLMAGQEEEPPIYEELEGAAVTAQVGKDVV